MDRSDKDKLTKNLSVLSAKTRWGPKLESALLERKVFSRTLLEPVASLPSEGERTHRLFVDVQKRGPRAFGALVKALVDSGNFEAARVLDPAVEVPREVLMQHRNNKVWNEPVYQPNLLSSTDPAPPSRPLPDNYVEAELVDDRTPVEVRVRPAAQYRGPPQLKAYPMQRKPRGMCLIIDNEVFDNDVMPRREGSHLDANNLDILFEQLGFVVVLRRNQTYGQMTREVTAFSKLGTHQAAQMCVVCILSHGNSGLIYSVDGRELPTEWVLRQFNNEGCPALKGKPKFFILQACRGEDQDTGFVPRLDTPEDNGGATHVDAQGVSRPRRVSAVHKDPTWEDMLIAYATVPGYVANRNLYRGTWFVESICRVFMENAADTDIREMLDEVSGQMRFYESEFGTKQSCSYEVRHFYKKLFFNPGIAMPEEEEGPADERRAATTNDNDGVSANMHDLAVAIETHL